jgi:hypothetical protein
MHISFVSPFDLEHVGQWNPNIFCGPASSLLFFENGNRLQDLAEIIEGLRLNEESVSEKFELPDLSKTIYRSSNLGYLRVYPDKAHFAAPLLEGRWCARPGDVIVNKIPLIRAAWVTGTLHRHAVDSNCLIIRGLQKPTGFWLTLCLNQQAYSSYVIQSSGASVLPRISISALKDLKIKETPAEADALAAKVWECTDEILTADEELVRLIKEVEDYISDFCLPSDLSKEEEDRLTLSQGRWFSAADIEDSWVPEHVELSHIQLELQRDSGWVPLSSLVTFGSNSRARLEEVGSGTVRYIRLKDVGSDLMVREPEPEESVQRTSRVFREPLSAGEVLISTLVTSSRSAFVDIESASTIYVTDHWERLRFRETPGAWSLILSTKAVRAQLERSAMGALQQFTNAQSIYKLRLPSENAIPWDLRARWHHSLVRHHQRKRELETRWVTLSTEAQQLFDQQHPSRHKLTRAGKEAASAQQGRSNDASHL